MPEYTAEMAHAAAAKGAAWMDKKCPNWWRELDLGVLNLRQPSVCVLGQSATCLLPKAEVAAWDGHPDYESVVQYFAPNAGDGWAKRLGFNIPLTEETERETATMYECLTIAWRELIRQRLEQAA